MRQNIRAAAIVIRDTKILLMHRIKDGLEYYVLPGGGVEENETVEQAVLREVAEETTLTISTEKLLYVHKYTQSTQYFYQCKYISGTPQLAANSEELLESSAENFFEPLWMETAQVKNLLLYPLEIRDWLIADIAASFSAATFPKTATISETDLRQTL